MGINGKGFNIRMHIDRKAEEEVFTLQGYYPAHGGNWLLILPDTLSFSSSSVKQFGL
jgi:hypothetical protein